MNYFLISQAYNADNALAIIHNDENFWFSDRGHIAQLVFKLPASMNHVRDGDIYVLQSHLMLPMWQLGKGGSMPLI